MSDVDGLTCDKATKTDTVYTEWAGDFSCGFGLNRPPADDRGEPASQRFRCSVTSVLVQ